MLKRVTPKRYEKVGAYQTAMESDVANLPANTRTIFTLRNVHYDEGVREDVFTRLQPRQGVNPLSLASGDVRAFPRDGRPRSAIESRDMRGRPFRYQ